MNIDDYGQMVIDSQNDFESFEVENLRTAVYASAMPAQIKNSIMNKVLSRNQAANMGLQVKEGNMFPGFSSFDGAAALTTFSFTRLTNTIPAPLAVPVGFSIYRETNYNQFLPSYNSPRGVTLSGVTILGDDFRFTFTDGTNTDVVILGCDNNGYASFNQSLNTNAIKIGKKQFQSYSSTDAVADSNARLQFSQNFYWYARTNMGKFSGNQINLGTFRQTDNFDKTILDAPIASVLTAQSGFILDVCRQVNAGEYKVSVVCGVEELARTGVLR